MKTDLQSRPQSRRLKGSAKPSARNINPEQAQDYFKKGKEEQSANNYQKAVELYLRATIYDPNYYQAFCNMGSCYRILGQYGESRKLYEKSIQIKSDDVISHYNLANVFRIIGNYEQSIDHYNFVIHQKERNYKEIGNLYLNSLVNAGICYKNQRIFDSAINCCEKALKIDPKDESALFNYGMCLMATLNEKNIEQFHEVSKQNAQKASRVFIQVLETNKDNQMGRLSLIELTHIFDKTELTITKAFEEYKKLLGDEKCQIRNEITKRLSYCQSILNKFNEERDKEKSQKQKIEDEKKRIEDLARKKQEDEKMRKEKEEDARKKIIAKEEEQKRKKEEEQLRRKEQEDKKSKAQTNIYDGVKQEEHAKIINNKSQIQKPPISEAQGLDMIETEKYIEISERLNQLDEEDMVKHTLQLILHLKQVDEDRKVLKVAYQLYLEKFKDVKFQDISIEAHKAIAKILSLMEQYENALTHYEHISKSDRMPKGDLHKEIGENLDAMGHKEKALEQYKKAIQCEPQNYELNFNIGCCLYDMQSYDESLKYFNSFKEEVKKDGKISQAQKDVFLVDCMVAIALSSEGKDDQLAVYQETFKALNELKNSKDNTVEVEIDANILLEFYIKFADLYEEKLVKLADSGEKDKKKEFKEKLFEVFEEMLDFENCPDRDAILTNCGNMLYEQKLYLNAIQRFNKIQNDSFIPYNSVALCYLHLYEHVMANKYMMRAYEIESDSEIVKFNYEIFCWVYGINEGGRLSQKFNCPSEQLLLNRLEYGLCLIDMLTLKINKLQEDTTEEQVLKHITELIEDEKNIKFEEEYQNKKCDLVLKSLKVEKQQITSYGIKPELAELIIKKAENEEQFKSLIESLRKMPKSKNQISIVQASLAYYIFNNQESAKQIRDIITGMVKDRTPSISLVLDLELPPENYLSFNIEGFQFFGFANCLTQWEVRLESYLSNHVEYLESLYYDSDPTSSLEFEYHLPRHNLLQDCSQNLNRLILIIYKVMNIQNSVTCKGSNIETMKKSFIREIEVEFNKAKKSMKNQVLCFSQDFVPLTIYSYHSSKEKVQEFVKKIGGKDIKFGQGCEITLLINKFIKVRCRWAQENYLEDALRSLVENPLFIVHQAVLSLVDQIDVLKQESKEIREELQKNTVFEF